MPKCTLEIVEPKDALYSVGRPVEPDNIQASFTVSPFDQLYKLALKCPGYRTEFFSVRYGTDVTPSKPLEFGTVTLSQEP